MELRVEKAVREFSHDHDNGVCKPTCYGCFIIAEAKEDMRTLQLQVEEYRKVLARISKTSCCDDVGHSNGELICPYEMALDVLEADAKKRVVYCSSCGAFNGAEHKSDCGFTEKRIAPCPKCWPQGGDGSGKKITHCSASISGCFGVDDNCCCSCAACYAVKHF